MVDDPLVVAQNMECNLNVSKGSGRSLKNFLSNAASCTGLSVVRSTEPESRSNASDRSLRRRMFPFFRNTPSTDISRYRGSMCQRGACNVTKTLACDVPICFMAEMQSSIKVGTRSVAGPAP